MKKVKNPNVGPIVGETTPTSVRLFGRGEPSKKYSCGVVRVEIPGGEAKVQFFKLLSDFDFTGVGVVTGLEPDTSHRYKLGWFKSDLELADLGQLQLDWSAVESNTFKTPTASRNAKRTFYVGSCRYNLPWASEDKDATDTRGDKTFRTMRRRLMQGDDVDGLLMLGDQIYADIGSVGVSRRKGFFRLYRGAFRQESLRQLMSMLPTYMTLDDHEIEDNWPAKKEDSDLIGKLPAALYAYMAYQMSHSPLLPHENGRLVGTPDHFWYQFSDGCCDVFMMDVRTERELTTVKKMIDEVQMEALKDFLKGDPDRVKIVGMGVPLFPDGSPDKWSGFPEQRAEILDYIFDNGIRKVVFLGGDVHLSTLSQLTCPDDPGFQIVSVLASPFFWPLPHSAKLKFNDITSDHRTYKIDPEDKDKVYRKENFVRLEVSPTWLRMKVFSRKGKEIKEARQDIKFT